MRRCVRLLPLAVAACLTTVGLGTAAHSHDAADRAVAGSVRDGSNQLPRDNDPRLRDTLLPGMSVPFPCGQAWVGSTRRSHSPSQRSVDFNRPNDMGKAVMASAPGIVRTAYASPKGGYGRWVVVDHGGGVSTLYAHLKKTTVVVGQTVDRGTMVGVVGDSGNTTGAHLHYEQVLERTVTSAAFGGVAYPYGPIVSNTCLDVPLAGNFSGGVEAEVALFRRDRRAEFVVNEPTGPRAMRYGGVIDEPVLGDWDGDGIDDLGLRSPRGNVFKLRTAAGVTRIRLGGTGDRPVSGDWDGTGVTQIGVFSPATATFTLRRADGSTSSVPLGDADDLPVTGDWNGDGRTDVGVFDRATAVFTLATIDAAGTVTTSQLAFGLPGDLPVSGDWDGNGITDLGTWTPATATFTQAGGPLADGARQVLRTVQFGRPR